MTTASSSLMREKIAPSASKVTAAASAGIDPKRKVIAPDSMSLIDVKRSIQKQVRFRHPAYVLGS